MKATEITKIYTRKLNELLGEGFQINPATMSGTQGEICKVDLTDGTHLYRLLLENTNSSEYRFQDMIRLTFGKYTEELPRGWRTFGAYNTAWNDRFDRSFQIDFYRIAEDWYTADKDEFETILAKRCHRYEIKPGRQYSCEDVTSEAAKAIALKYLRRQPRLSRCKPEQIVRIRKNFASTWGDVHENYTSYEIEYSGSFKKTFTLAPRKA